MNENTQQKYIAIYYPQFHRIAENDKAWGKGFTDWERVKACEPLFDGHYQPRIPLDNKYYDASKPETIFEQASLAQKYGIDAFCFYHYWFDGKLLLQKPMENFIANSSINMQFCISWANETWSKRWVGKANEIIQHQSHKPDRDIWRQHFEYLLKFFKDKRYILVDNKPMFLIYQPSIINKLNEMIDLWNELAIENGFSGIYFIATKRQKNMSNIDGEKFNAIMKFQPQEVVNSHMSKERGRLISIVSNISFYFPENIRNKFAALLDKRRKTTFIDSDLVCEKIIQNAFSNSQNHKKKTFESIYVNWDNTSRYGAKANIYSHISPAKFGEILHKMKRKMIDNNSEYLFINAWNEWAEGAYLEPDEMFKYKYLDELKKTK